MTAYIKDLSINETWQFIEKALNENPEHIKGMATTYGFELSGEDGGSYGLTIVNGEAKVSTGVLEEADCTLSMSEKDFKKLLVGKLNATASYMMGKLKVNGSLGLALKLESLLKKYTFE